MRHPFALFSALLLLSLTSCQTTPDAFIRKKQLARAKPPAALNTPREAEDLTSPLETLRNTLGVPAIAAAVVDLDGPIAIGAAGIRKLDAQAPATISDKFHIGSCTKSMTAVLAARLVDAQSIQWDTTLAKTFPGYIYHMQPALKPVTLRMLLANRSGQSTEETNALILRVLSVPHTLTEQKALLLRDALNLKPIDNPGTATQPGVPYHYSNVGYFLAGMMLEASTAQPWQRLMREEVFLPMGLESAGFGPAAQPGFPDNPDQTWGHKFEAGKLIPVPPGPDADNPEIMGPAGTVHMNVQDFASYAQFHLQNLSGQPELITLASAQVLYEPYPGPPVPGKSLPGQKPATDIGYALGLVVFEHQTLGKVYFHTGSNTMNTAIFLIAPEKHVASVVMTNASKPDTQDALINYALALAMQYTAK